MNPSSPIVEVKDVKLEVHTENSCNSRCCVPKSPKLKRNATDKKVSETSCKII